MRKSFIVIVAFLLTLSIPCVAQLTLDSCRHLALRNNKELLQQQVKIEAAGYQVQQAKAAYLPTVDFEGSYIYNSRKLAMVDKDQMLPTKTFNLTTGAYDYNIVINPATGQPLMVDGQYVPSTVALLPKDALTYDVHNVFAGALTITQPIYMGGKIKAMNDMSHYAEELAMRMRDSKTEDVIYDVDAAYWQVVSLKAKQKLADSYVNLVSQLNNDVQSMLKQGVATKASVLNVEVKLNEAQVDLTRVNNGVALAKMHLAQLCGLPIDDKFTLADEDKENWETNLKAQRYNMDDVYAKRNDVQSLTLAAQIYDQKAKVARSEMLPQVAAMGMVHATNPNMYNGFANKFGAGVSVGAVVKIPIWHWGGLDNKYRQAQTDAKLKWLELEDAKDKINLQVNQASFRYQEAYKTYEMTKSNLAKAEENLRMAEVGFKEGISTADDVMTAQTAWLKANSERVDAEIDVHMCDVYLSKVLGTMKY